MVKTVVITGVAGEIGQAMSVLFKKNGYRVIGLDLFSRREPDIDDIKYDLELLSTEVAAKQLEEIIVNKMGDASMWALINNAAVQSVAPIQELSIEQFNRSLQVNCTAAYALVKLTHKMLAQNSGTVINIGSIHTNLTKPHFSAYAASKAALEGLTRALAVELGAGLQVCGIRPAAIETDMLKSGFEGDLAKLEALRDYHPVKQIGAPEDVADLAFLLVDKKLRFTNGATWNLDGGIGCRLHDPADVSEDIWSDD